MLRDEKTSELVAFKRYSKVLCICPLVSGAFHFNDKQSGELDRLSTLLLI